MKITSLICLASCICLFACQDSPKESTATYDVGLAELKKIILPVDENTYYMSRSIFQFEEDGREFLHFENTEKRQYEIIIYDIESQKLKKRIPLDKQGPNAVPAVLGSKPFGDSNTFIFFQNNMGRITLYNTAEQVMHKYKIATPEGSFMGFAAVSYYYSPSFVKDSVLYVSPNIGKLNMTKEYWATAPMFFSLDLRTKEIDFLPLRYPKVFHQHVKNLAMGSEFSYDYNYVDNRLVCSFSGYDSIMVSDDLRKAKWYDGKSRYERDIHVDLCEASGGVPKLLHSMSKGQYIHIMYDRYRDVYYRFVEHTCEYSEGEYLMDEPKAREFSVIIFDKDFQIIGETKFPGNKYLYKMSFVGRDGLYISENNEANPEFDENKLVFACFKLEDMKNEQHRYTKECIIIVSVKDRGIFKKHRGLLP